MTIKTEDIAKKIATLVNDRKAQNITVLDLRGLSSYTDFLVICSGTSDRQVQAIAEWVASEMRDEKLRPIGVEGIREGQWALVDYGSVVLHVFHEFTRDVYQLEQIWKEAPRLEINLDDLPSQQTS